MTTTAGAGGVRHGAPVQFKAVDEGWQVEGWCSTYDVDLGNDRVVPGCFKATLASGGKVRFLYAHQADKVLGTPLTLEEDGRTGLYGRFRISKTQLGQDVRQLLLDGALDSFSIGYIPRDFDVDPRSGVRRLKRVDLLECSVVAMAMNPAAVVTAAKQASQKSLVLPVLERYVAELKTRERVLATRERFRRMSYDEVRREAETMKLRMRARELAGLVGAGR